MKKVEFDETIFVPFLSMVNDTRQMYSLTDHLQGVKRFLFKGKEGTITAKAQMFLSSNLEVVLKELEDRGLVPAEDSKQQEFLDAIIHRLRYLPQVKVTLAFEPSVTFIAFMNSTISKECGQKVLLDIVVDQFIVAGASFENEGKYADYTLSKSIDEFIGNYIRNMAETEGTRGTKSITGTKSAGTAEQKARPLPVVS